MAENVMHPQTHLLDEALRLQRSNQLDAALAAYSQVLQSTPENAVALTGMAILLQQMGKLTEAEQQIRKALAATGPQSVQLGILASNLIEQGRVAEARDAIDIACAQQPNLAPLQSNRLLYSLYDHRMSAAERFALHREVGHRLVPAGSVSTPRARRSKGGRLRVGYASADFRNHPVGTFFEPLLQNADRAGFEIFCYSDVRTGDAVTSRLRQAADHWVATRDAGGEGGEGMSDSALLKRIRQDDIDILIDLGGHTQDNRLPVFAARPAPLQLTHIGYPCTTGLPTIDYRFSDALLDPPGPDDALYSEKTWRLPAFWCYEAPDPCPEVGPLPCTHSATFTFGSFNNLAKINPLVIDTWAWILQRLPGSRLLLKYKALHDAAVRQRFIAAFAAHGIDAGRIETLPGSSVQEYMADFNRLDLGLDPFPFNGGTTTFNSFYMGVPVVALEGRGHAERMGAALLRHVGLDDFVAPTVDAYIERAVALASDRQRLAKIRASLRDRLKHSSLMDGLGYTRAYEAALRAMYEEAIAKIPQPPSEPKTIAPVPQPIRLSRIINEPVNAEVHFSLIVAGRDPRRRDAAAAHLRQRFHGRGFELWYADTPPSLAAAYNAAIEQATGKLLIFMHDDAELLNEEAPERIRHHLQTYDLLGIAGTTRLVSGVWSHSGQPHIFGQVANPPAAPVKEGYTLCVFGGISAVAGGMRALDGVFLAGRRSTFQQLQFDAETFDGFHLYDTDFTFRAFQAGLKLAVANDVHLFHQSVGNYDAVWREYHERFLKKFAGQLAPHPQAKIWFAQIYCRTLTELREKMNRNSSPARGFTF